MTFLEMIETPGWYVCDSFSKGTCIKITKEGDLKYTTYKDKYSFADDFQLPFNRGMLKKTYRKVFSVPGLFKDFEERQNDNS